MHTAVPSEPFHRIPELLGRLPLPSEVWSRTEPRLPAALRQALARVSSLSRGLPDLSARRIFAAVIPAGLVLGWLASYAVDPEIMQRGGKPYAEVIGDGVRVQLPRLASELAYPEDPAPFGYRDAAAAPHLEAGIADAGQYADTAGPDGADPVQVADGQVLGGALGNDAGPVPQPAPAAPVIQVVPQDAPQ